MPVREELLDDVVMEIAGNALSITEQRHLLPVLARCFHPECKGDLCSEALGNAEVGGSERRAAGVPCQGEHGHGGAARDDGQGERRPVRDERHDDPGHDIGPHGHLNGPTALQHTLSKRTPSRVRGAHDLG